MANKTFNVSMDEELVKKIDAAAKKQYTSRSEFLRSIAVEKLEQSKAENLDNEYRKFVEQYGQTLKNLAKR